MPKLPSPQHSGPGAQSFSVGYEDFIKGMSTSKDIADGGFSSEGTSMNLYLNPGKITPSPIPTDITNNLPGSFHGFAASCPSNETGSFPGFYRVAVDFLGDIYKYSTGGSWTQPAVDGTNIYHPLYSDMVFYANNYYLSSHNVSTGDNVCQWNGNSTTVADWFHTNFKVSGTSQYLKLNVVHPMLVFNKTLYIADGNMIHSYDGTNFNYAGNGNPINTLTLSTETNITALSIDPQTGRMMVAFTTTTGLGETPAISKLGLWDGVNPTQFIKIVALDDFSFCIYPLGGTVYIFYGNNLGYWNGNGVTFIRALSGFSGTFKQRVTSIGNDLYFFDGANFIIYSELIGGSGKLFSNINMDTVVQGAPQILFYLDGRGVPTSPTYLCYAGQDVSNNFHLMQFDVGAVGSSTSTTNFYSNPYFFPRQAYIRAIDIIMDSTLGASETVTPTFIIDTGSEFTTNPTQMTNVSPIISRFQCGSVLTTVFKLRLQLATGKGFRRAIIYYDYAE